MIQQNKWIHLASKTKHLNICKSEFLDVHMHHKILYLVPFSEWWGQNFTYSRPQDSHQACDQWLHDI